MTKQMQAHEAKLKAYIRDPEKYDDGRLRNASTAHVRQKIIEGRVAILRKNKRIHEANPKYCWKEIVAADLKVSLDIIRRAVEILLAKVASESGVNVPIAQDYFWAIDPEQVYDIYSDPTKFTIGQVSEAVDNLVSIIEDPEMVVNYGLVWVSQVLNAIGPQLPEAGQ